MSVNITIQETIQEVDITVNQNVIAVTVTRTSGGGGVETITGTTVNNTDPLNPVVNVPSLPQVKTIGDDIFDSVSGDRDFELADRTRYLQLLSVSVTLNESVITFPDNSCIVGAVFDSDSDLIFPDGVYYIDAPITSITLNKGDRFELKNSGSANIWVLTVTNKGTGGGGAVDSVNGQTGVVVLDASDVGAEPTKGSDDNYVTDAQLVVIGNTSGTNSGDNATNTKYEAVARTGAVVSFDLDAVYNSIASPSSSNITFDFTGARLKIVQKMYHNSGTAPTVTGGVLRGNGTYVVSTLNIIYLEWSVGTTVEYWITQ